jgi:hypothetical protein
MKRVLFTVLWFVVLYIGALAIGGGVAGALAQSQVPAGPDQNPNFSQAYAKGHDAGREFGRRFSGIILLGALAASITGGAMGILPGTRRKDPSDGA